MALAHALVELGPIAILFATGNPAEVHRRARVGHGCLAKPFEGGVARRRAARHPTAASPTARIPGFTALTFDETP